MHSNQSCPLHLPLLPPPQTPRNIPQTLLILSKTLMTVIPTIIARHLQTPALIAQKKIFISKPLLLSLNPFLLARSHSNSKRNNPSNKIFRATPFSKTLKPHCRGKLCTEETPSWKTLSRAHQQAHVPK